MQIQYKGVCRRIFGEFAGLVVVVIVVVGNAPSLDATAGLSGRR